MSGGPPDAPLVAKLGGSVGAFAAADWDALDPSGNPFVSHAFLTALEDSGSVGEGSGWQPAPIVIEDGEGTLCAALPSYLKGHSQGEYVFDHAWADAFERAGGRYYPKLQIAAPFTPATGPRLLLADEALAGPLLEAAQQLCSQNDFSSAHASFIETGQQRLFEQAGWMLRHDVQFHWHNRDYASFDDFLADLSSRGRAQFHRPRRALRALLGLHAGHPLPAFRTVLLSGDRRGDRARPDPGRGRRAGRTQAGARLRAGHHGIGALDRRSGLCRGGGGFPRARTRGRGAGQAVSGRTDPVPQSPGIICNQAARRPSIPSHSRARRCASAISRAVISSEMSARHQAASS